MMHIMHETSQTTDEWIYTAETCAAACHESHGVHGVSGGSSNTLQNATITLGVVSDNGLESESDSAR